LGDLIYDSYVRYDLSFLNENLTIKFLTKLFLSIFKFLTLKKFIVEKKIKYLITEGGSYANISGLSARISGYLNIIQYSIHFDRKGIFRLIKKKGLKDNPNKKNKFNFNKKDVFKFTKNMSENYLDKFFINRYKGKISTLRTNKLDILNSNRNKKKYTKKRFLRKVFNIDKLDKKIVVIAPHAFSDAPHHDGIIFFKDYYEHFYKTIDHIKNKKLKNIYWVLKPHPSSKNYGEKNIVENFEKKLNLKNVKMCPKDIDSQDLSAICDHVVTCTGTIALEFAIKGKYSINAGISEYSNFGVTLDHTNKKSYFQTLENIDKIKLLNKKQILFSKKLLYFLENFSPGKVLDRGEFFSNTKLEPNKSNDQNDIIDKKFVNFFLKYKIEKDNMIKNIYNKL
tara:strand:- start:8 stop:1192 length:1185 start_codon:yes stop_codon:yes gene_type:complete